jgi:hypothetical protein
LFVVQSHVSDIIEKTTDFLKNKQPPLLMRNSGREFQNVSFASGDAFKSDLSARGMAVGDLDNDGDTDVVIAQINEAPMILRNNGTKNNWIGIDLRGVKSPASGEGSRLVVTDASGKKQTFDAGGAGSYISANDSRILVGLGEASAVQQIEIRWTSGKIQKIEKPVTRRYHVIKEQ